MANFEVLSLDPTTPQIRAPGAGDGYSVPRDMTFSAGTTLNAPTTVVSVNTSTDALRITQVGAGNALLVEDSANPDASPTAITATGAVGIGTATPSTVLHVKGTVGGTDPTVVTGERVRIQSNDTTGRSAYMSLIAGTAANSGVLFGDQDAADVGQIRYLHSDNSMQFYTSSAERMRLDTSGNLGIGTASPAVKLDVVGAVSATGNITSGGILQALGTVQSSSGADLSLNANGANRDVFLKVNGTTLMTVQGSTTNVGIGTTSPSDILTLAGGASGSYGVTINNAKEGGGTKAIFQYDRDNALAVVGANTTNGLVFKTLTGGSLTTKATIDASGNLGLGVTPGTWTLSGSSAMQIKNAGWMGYLNNSYFTANASNAAGTWKYIASAAATLYEQNGGTHAWSYAASGTAGNAITFTQAMTLDASGNLGIGTTSPGQKLEVSGNQRFTGSQVGTKIENRQTAVSVSTATTILDDAGALGKFVVVNGEASGNRFCDLVLCSTGVSPTVVSSFTALGTPAARTYTRSGSALQLAMASGTYSVYVLALGY